jgi:hypothetical protein
MGVHLQSLFVDPAASFRPFYKMSRIGSIIAEDGPQSADSSDFPTLPT